MTHMKSLLAAGFLVAGTIAAQPAAAGTFWDVYGPIGRSVSDELARTAADAMVKEGTFGRLIDHGWTYINLDDGWERSPRLGDALNEGPTIRFAPDDEFLALAPGPLTHVLKFSDKTDILVPGFAQFLPELFSVLLIQCF